MKLRLLAPLLTGLAFFFSTAITSTRPSLAEDTTFFCGTSQGIPVSYARTARGSVPMIRWVSTNYFPPPWTPQRRCQEVSRRFQQNYKNETPQLIVSGTLNGVPAICAAKSQDEACTNNTLLFTLKPGSDAKLTIQRLLDSRGLAAGIVVNESAYQRDCPIAVNVATYLNNATVEKDTTQRN